MLAGKMGQENMHLTSQEIIDFITEKEYKQGMLENSAPILFHLVSCESCRRFHEMLKLAIDITDEETVRRELKNTESGDNGDDVVSVR